MHSLKYLRSLTLGCKDIRIRKSEFSKESVQDFFLLFFEKPVVSYDKLGADDYSSVD